MEDADEAEHEVVMITCTDLLLTLRFESRSSGSPPSSDALSFRRKSSWRKKPNAAERAAKDTFSSMTLLLRSGGKFGNWPKSSAEINAARVNRFACIPTACACSRLL